MNSVLDVAGDFGHRFYPLQEDYLLPRLSLRQSLCSLGSSSRVLRTTYPKVMNHVAMQHADSRKGNLVADNRPVSGVISKPSPISDRRILEVEVLRGTSFDGVCDCRPRKATMACTDNPSFVVVLVERVL